jgi:hypothetical protein
MEDRCAAGVWHWAAQRVRSGTTVAYTTLSPRSCWLTIGMSCQHWNSRTTNRTSNCSVREFRSVPSICRHPRVRSASADGLNTTGSFFFLFKTTIAVINRDARGSNHVRFRWSFRHSPRSVHRTAASAARRTNTRTRNGVHHGTYDRYSGRQYFSRRQRPVIFNATWLPSTGRSMRVVAYWVTNFFAE